MTCVLVVAEHLALHRGRRWKLWGHEGGVFLFFLVGEDWELSTSI